MTDAGSCAGVSCWELYASTVERAANPTQFPVVGAYCLPTWDSVAGSRLASPPLLSTSVIAGEFSVAKTSPGEAGPSWTIWFAMSGSSPDRMSTLIPVSLVNPATISFMRSSCWAL